VLSPNSKPTNLSASFALKSSRHQNIDEDGRLRFKLLTNFVNAYKEKMFLSNTTGMDRKG
jgi:hypothetical protein